MQIGKKVDIDSDAIQKLQEYDWPGNVRELENVIERILALSEGGKISLSQVTESIAPTQDVRKISTIIPVTDGQSLKNTVDDYEKQIIEEALKANRGSRVKAAKQLGLTRQNFQYKLKKYGWAWLHLVGAIRELPLRIKYAQNFFTDTEITFRFHFWFGPDGLNLPCVSHF